MYIEIENNITPLRKEKFSFWLNDTSLILNTYFLMEQTPGKRKYATIGAYNRLMKRDSTIKAEDVPLTPVIKQRAIDSVISKLTCIKDMEA